MDEQVVRSDPDVAVAARSGSERVQDRADAEWREDMRCNLQTKLPPDGPGLVGGRIAEIDLAAHDHVDEAVARQVARREPLLQDARRVLRILVARHAGAEITGALEIAEGGTTPGIDQRLNGGVRVRRRVTDLRDIVHRGDAVVELAEPA